MISGEAFQRSDSAGPNPVPKPPNDHVPRELIGTVISLHLVWDSGVLILFS